MVLHPCIVQLESFRKWHSGVQMGDGCVVAMISGLVGVSSLVFGLLLDAVDSLPSWWKLMPY